MGINMTGKSIVLENRYVKILFSREDARVESIFDKVHGKELKGEDTHFFCLVAQDKETVVAPTAIGCTDGCVTVETPLGAFQVAVVQEEEYFTFELLSELPAASYKGILAHAKYDYDFSGKGNTGAAGIAMTYWANPCFYPDAKARETKAEAVTSLRSKGAKYGLIVAPITEHKQIIKKLCLTIDPNQGIVTKYGGAWARDAKPNCGNYMLELESDAAFIQRRLPLYKKLGLDQVDIHQWPTTFRQGDFKYLRYDNPAEFKKNVVDVLRENGFGAGLHTYSSYIDYESAPILSDPKWQKDLGVLETVTLAEDIDENAGFIPTVESTDHISNQDGFLSRNTPFLLIGEELIRFEMDTHGFRVAQRGVCGTKPAAHTKGEKISHIEGLYRMITPTMGSELFFQIARDTAKAYNEGGYEMIYADALDGIYHHCGENPEHAWYYLAAFVHEILIRCNTTPIFDCSTRSPSLWLIRGRYGNIDTPKRGYKRWNKAFHLPLNLQYMDMYMQPSLGWFWFYPTEDEYPGNSHTKYMHTDAVEYMGALAVMYNFNMVYVDMEEGKNESCRACDRNIAIYRKYDELRKADYFTEETLEKVRAGKWEYHIVQRDDGSYVFVEKDYQNKKLYDLTDAQRNKAAYSNPFAAQKPFLRLEALMAAQGTEQEALLALDKERELTGQVLEKSFDGSVDLSTKLARKVSICGNGKPGIIAIKLYAGITTAKSYAEYIIDTDFEGWREFTLLESDNGERSDVALGSEVDVYQVYRHDFDHKHVTKIAVEATGDMTGVKMGDIVAVNHMYEVLKNPTVRVGDSAVTFECELTSTEYIEFDGVQAKVIDRYGNEKAVWFSGELTVPAGSFEAELTAKPLNGGVARAQLTFGFTGQEVTQSADTQQC